MSLNKSHPAADLSDDDETVISAVIPGSQEEVKYLTAANAAYAAKAARVVKAARAAEVARASATKAAEAFKATRAAPSGEIVLPQNLSISPTIYQFRRKTNTELTQSIQEVTTQDVAAPAVAASSDVSESGRVSFNIGEPAKYTKQAKPNLLASSGSDLMTPRPQKVEPEPAPSKRVSGEIDGLSIPRHKPARANINSLLKTLDTPRADTTDKPAEGPHAAAVSRGISARRIQ